MKTRLFSAVAALLFLAAAVVRAGESRLLFLGNSITLHGPLASIGWSGNWGMAASVAEKDYVHLVIDGVAQRSGQKPESKVVNLAEFERGFETFDFAAKLKAETEFHADTIIVALGENVPALTTDEARAKFQERTTKLLQHLKSAGAATIYVRSCFWPDEPKDAALKAACEAVGGIYVDIGALAKDETNFARSERKIDHVGVAGHPGDKGMKAIAEALLAAMAKAKK